MTENDNIAQAKLPEIERYQSDRLKELLGYLNANSPFYKAHFIQNNIDLSTIESIEDLRSIPTTTKFDMQRHNWDFLCVARQQIAEYASTSGTLGSPVTIALTQTDIDRLAYNECQSFKIAGCDESDLFQLLLTLDRQFMAGLAYYAGIRNLGAGVIRVGPGLPMLQWDCIHKYKPSVLVAVPSFLIKLIDYAAQHGFDPNESSVQKIICIGESVKDQSMNWNALGKRIRDTWPIELHSTYASTEMQTAFTECDQQNGGHLQADLLIVEILDDMLNPLPAGQVGEVTITTLGVQGMPLLRFQTGDMAMLMEEPCACGRNTPRLSPILGRKNQMIKLKGTTIYPAGVAELIQQCQQVKEYVIEAFTGDLGMDELRIFIFTEPTAQNQVEQELKQKFQSGLRIVPEILFTSKATLDEKQMSGSERKVNRFLDKRIF
ncbi:MAG: AMP-binding protein [Saprospiraceae bacterium]